LNVRFLLKFRDGWTRYQWKTLHKWINGIFFEYF